MKKIRKIIAASTVMAIFMLSLNAIGANDIYSPIGDGDDFETENFKKNKDFYNEGYSRAAINVNDYLIKNNIKPATIKLQYNRLNVTSPYDKMAYNTTNKLPKGIIIHATAGGANDDINNEITYMNRNWRNAFVQAFSDYKEIVEVHNPSYAAWGAGPKANPYYIHIELVETGNKDRFMNSVNNQAYYAASKLKQFNLKPSRAKSDKSGSVWFHSEVTKYLGGTDHSDPTGYFKKHGYSLAEFYKLVEHHYKKIDDLWKTTTTKTYHSNKKVSSKTTTKTYNKKVYEKNVYKYNTLGYKTSLDVMTYHSNGKVKTHANYIYKMKTSTTTYKYKRTRKNINAKSIVTSQNIALFSKTGRQTSYKNYTNHSNGKKKILKTTEYTARKVSGVTRNYYKMYSEERWSSKNKKYKNIRYYYNRRGMLQSNGYGKAKRNQYIYVDGKLKQRKHRYYSKYGYLNKKTYYKKY